MNLTCQSLSLEKVLADECDLATEAQVQQHLESCDQCRERLETLAADRQTWNDAARNLSTANQLAVTQNVKQKLEESSSFLIPSGVFNSRSADGDVDDRLHEIAASESSAAAWKRLLDPPKHPEMLGQIDHFEVEEKIGQGGMGIVLKGFDRQLDRAVAIKVLSPHLASNATARKRFAREAQAAAAVVHPNVVPIFSVNQNVERPYIAMQLVSGLSLQSLVEKEGPLDFKSVVRIAIQIADGLSAAHEQGLIHRDVKPANVLTEHDVSRVMITDFGLARAVDDAGMTQTGWLAGTPHYMSPEQARGDDVDPRSDLFSLGSLMYFLATGREPFRAERSYGVIQKIIHDPVLAPCRVNNEVPPMLSASIERLLEKNPEARFQSASELANHLRDYLAHIQSPNVAQPPIKTPPRAVATDGGGNRYQALWIVGAILTAIAPIFIIGFLWIVMKAGFKNEAGKQGQISPPMMKPMPAMPEMTPMPSMAPMNQMGQMAKPQPSEVIVLPTARYTGDPLSPNNAPLMPELSDDSLFREIDQMQKELDQLEQSFENGAFGKNND